MQFKLINLLFLFRERVLLLIMKSCIFLIVITFFGFTSEYSFSQEKVIIEKDQLATVNQIFKIIKKQTQFNFVYPKDAFLNMPKVQLKKGEITVIKLLEQTFENDNINFEFSKDKTIFIKRNAIIKKNKNFSASIIEA